MLLCYCFACNNATGCNYGEIIEMARIGGGNLLSMLPVSTLINLIGQTITTAHKVLHSDEFSALMVRKFIHLEN